VKALRISWEPSREADIMPTLRRKIIRLSWHQAFSGNRCAFGFLQTSDNSEIAQ
jgi:hypothetical protein